MKQVLGKKQSSLNEDFVNAWNNIEQLVSREEAERLVASAVSDIREKTYQKLYQLLIAGDPKKRTYRVLVGDLYRDTQNRDKKHGK